MQSQPKAIEPSPKAAPSTARSNGRPASGTARTDREGGAFLARLEGGLATMRRHPDLALVALLLLLTATISRSFSTGVHVGPIYVTEVVMALAAAIAIIRLGIGESWRVLRRLPLPALALFWTVGAIAALRGIGEFGFSQTSDDVGLAVYSLVLPLLALVVVDRERHRALFGVLVACGFAAMATFAITYSADQLAGSADTLLTLQGAAAGLYMSLAVSWIAARVVNGVPTPTWLIALAPVGVVLMGLTSQRSVWMVAILSLAAVTIFAPRRAMLRTAAGGLAVLAVCFVAAAGIQSGITNTGGGVQGSGENLATSSESGAPQLVTEIAAVTGEGESGESANVAWRLAYWRELVGRTPDAPLLGVGFGQPSAFVWRDLKYDFRDGDPTSPGDVTGPHNSFVHILYRMGIPALLVVLFLLAVAAVRVRSAFRDGRLAVGDRVTLTTLVAMLAAGIMASSFNEGLTGPYLGLFFWVPLGMLLLWPPVHGRGGEPAQA